MVKLTLIILIILRDERGKSSLLSVVESTVGRSLKDSERRHLVHGAEELE